jgi:phospholipid/cholesterol/gamma-HCH transport system permease protein
MEPGYLQSNIIGFFRSLTLLTNFGVRFILELFKRPFEFREFVKQSYFVGNKSLLLIAITAFIMGLVLTVQTRPELAKFGAESWLPAMVAVSIVKEIGPVITAVIFAGKTGSGIGAELASMRVTEQIDAMEASGVNPFKYVVVTRVLATTLMLPLLVVFADAVALYGSFFGINLKSSINLQLFISQVFQKLAFSDLFPAVVKTFLFGFAIGLVSCYIGYNINEGTAGVGKAANKAVVFGSLMVFLIDMIAVQVTILVT